MTIDEIINFIIGPTAEYDGALQELALEYILRRIQLGATRAATANDVSLSFDVRNPKVQEWIQHYSGLMANRVNETVREKIRESLSEGLAAGETTREVTSRIAQALGAELNEAGKLIASDAMKYRAEMIARTELARAEMAGRDWQLKDAGATRVIWRANPDACEFCAEIDGREIAVGESFFKQGDSLELSQLPEDVEAGRQPQVMHFDYSDVDYPPAHPHCLCDVSYEFDD